LKNKETKVVKKSKERKILCLEDEMIDNCECKHFADNAWMPSDSDPALVQDDLSFGALQHTVDVGQSVLLELDIRNGAASVGIPPLISKNSTPVFGHLLYPLFNKSLSTGGSFPTWHRYSKAAAVTT
jgi:hypothetical protein